MKNANNSTRKRKNKKIVSAEVQEVIYAWKAIPISEAQVEKWAEELDVYASKPENRTITGFYRSKGLQNGTYYRLLDRHQVLKEAHENALRTMGERLWLSAVDRNANWQAVQWGLQNYAPEFKDNNKYHSDLKTTENAAMGIETVKLQEIQRTRELDEFEKKKGKNVQATQE